MPAYWRVTCDNPPFNIFGPETIRHMKKVVSQIGMYPDLRVVVFDSAVPGSFLTHDNFTPPLLPATCDCQSSESNPVAVRSVQASYQAAARPWPPAQCHGRSRGHQITDRRTTTETVPCRNLDDNTCSLHARSRRFL